MKYHGHVCLSSTGDTTINSAIAGVGKDMVTIEFIITSDAEDITNPADPADQTKAYMGVFNEL